MIMSGVFWWSLVFWMAVTALIGHIVTVFRGWITEAMVARVCPMCDGHKNLELINTFWGGLVPKWGPFKAKPTDITQECPACEGLGTWTAFYRKMQEHNNG